jgi:hypothetical protein
MSLQDQERPFAAIASRSCLPMHGSPDETADTGFTLLRSSKPVRFAGCLLEALVDARFLLAPFSTLPYYAALADSRTSSLAVDRLMTASSSKLPKPDKPIPFGYKVAWFALQTDDAHAVAKALSLRDVRPSTWTEGIETAYESAVFVTPPLGSWVLAVGRPFFPPGLPEPHVKPLVKKLSSQFLTAQYFCTYRVAEGHFWASARKGRLVRGYAYNGCSGETQWDEGDQTKEERELGFRFFDERSSDAAKPGYWERKDLSLPNETCVMRLAELWSVDPTTLDQHFKEPSLGLLGSFAWEP